MKTKFKCDKCGCEPEELWSFGNFGNNPLKVSDNKEYCETCFKEVCSKYELKYQSETSEDSQSKNQYLLTGS